MAEPVRAEGLRIRAEALRITAIPVWPGVGVELALVDLYDNDIVFCWPTVAMFKEAMLGVLAKPEFQER